MSLCHVGGKYLNTLHNRSVKGLPVRALLGFALQPGVLQGLLSCGPQGRVPVQQAAHKALRLITDACPAASVEVDSARQNGTPVKSIQGGTLYLLVRPLQCVCVSFAVGKGSQLTRFWQRLA